MAALTLLYELVRIEAPNCPEPVLTHALRLAAEEFYARTLIKRVELADITTVSGTAEYALTLPAGYALAKALHVWLDDGEITPIGMDDRDKLGSAWREETDEPTHFYLPDLKNIGLFKTPDGVYTVTVEAALQPSYDATTIDDWVYQQYREGIAHGATARLMSMVKTPWFSEAAGHHARLFQQAMDSATQAANKGHGRAAKRTRPVFGVR